MKQYNKLHKSFVSILMMFGLMIPVSCEYKDFIEEDPYNRIPVQISFDWQNVDSIPTKMQVMFYPEDTGGYQRFDIGNTTTTVNVLPGQYHITAWNNDATHVYFNGYDNRLNINATTPAYNTQNSQGIQNLLDSLFNGQQVLDYPDYMVHANRPSVGVGKNNPKEIVLTPDSMVVTVEMNLGGIAGLELVKGIKGALSNVAGRRYMAYDNKATDPTTVLFEARGNATDSTVTARFWVFGLEPEELAETNHKAAVFFWTDRGNVFLELDIKKFIDENEDKNKLVITMPDLDIDIRDFIDSGWNIFIDDWNNEDHPIGF